MSMKDIFKKFKFSSSKFLRFHSVIVGLLLYMTNAFQSSDPLTFGTLGVLELISREFLLRSVYKQVYCKRNVVLAHTGYNVLSGSSDNNIGSHLGAC
jgi:hypothetical protein